MLHCFAASGWCVQTWLLSTPSLTPPCLERCSWTTRVWPATSPVEVRSAPPNTGLRPHSLPSLLLFLSLQTRGQLLGDWHRLRQLRHYLRLPHPEGRRQLRGRLRPGVLQEPPGPPSCNPAGGPPETGRDLHGWTVPARPAVRGLLSRVQGGVPARLRVQSQESHRGHVWENINLWVWQESKMKMKHLTSTFFFLFSSLHSHLFMFNLLCYFGVEFLSECKVKIKTFFNKSVFIWFFSLKPESVNIHLTINL